MSTVLRNGKIYTVNDEMPFARALVYDGEKISYAGPDDEGVWGKFAGREPDIIDLKGKTVIPGIIDAHIHPGMCCQSAWHIRLPWTEDADEVLAFIKDYALKHPKEEIPFLYFEYYPTSMFGTRGPTKELLDSAVSDRPCMCQDFGEHMHWYNSKMLEMMGVDKDTPDPVPGLQMFVRDEKGEPTGWGKELVHLHFAEELYKNLGWTPPMEMTPEIMEPFFEFINGAGITAIGEGILEGEAQISSMYELDREGKLNCYYDGLIRFDSYEELLVKIEELKRFEKKYGNKHIKLNTMKLFLDGTNESGNSALLNEHVNALGSGNYGEILMEKDELKKCFLKCNEEGLDLHIHMVGDRAFRVGCDAVEAAQAQVAREGKKWVCQPVFAHCEIVDPADMERPAKLGITINWSCHWSGGYFGEEAKAFLGEEKWERMYQFNPIIESGAVVAFSSDVVTNYELHRADPFFSMQVANTRVDPEFPLDPDKYPGSVRPPESAKISMDMLLKGYTLNGAKQMHWERIMGSLEQGKLANMLVLTDDLFEVEPSRIREMKPEAIIFEGRLLRGKL